ncbi:hypothetical protein UA08_07359 [Talaromyces atroroseus]|uniref:Major facilitator superfamily (MFS) profile domain-containing protein n=1 Tax=Talaromyces atroroseus TaxID=1441469 RepID=A0A225ARY5_TALAT|nr:hypothetical protein UA08_07359 [Talaromyces atroroseus]OKL57205.1 hypothetical protein UA08_07359 [Talaromyces atroroseus]
MPPGIKSVGATSTVMQKYDEAGTSDGEQQFVVDWTEGEERRLVNRDKSGNALTDYFLADVGITQNQYNVGQQLLSVGIVIWEQLHSISCWAIGVDQWADCRLVNRTPTSTSRCRDYMLTALIRSLVATFQAFQKGLGAFLVTRLLLGLCESGFIPAGLYTITRWYKRNESSKRFSWFFVGNMLAQAVSGLAAYGMCIEGLFGIVVGAIFILLFPRDVASPLNIFGYAYFTERETEILVRRLLLDDPSKAQRRRNINKDEILRALTNWRLLPHVLLTIAALAPSSTMWSYAPKIVEGLGYGRLRSNAMVSVGQWIQLVLNIAWGYTADKMNIRGPVVLAGMILWWAFALACRLLIYSTDSHSRYAVLTLAIAFSSVWRKMFPSTTKEGAEFTDIGQSDPVNGSWMALNARSAGERSITLAIFIMSANASGIVGSQLFQSGDAPLYPIGWSLIVSLVSFGLFLTIFANIQYWLCNLRIARKAKSDGKERKLYFQ